MPSAAFALKIAGVVLEYGMLLWLLYFLMRATGYILRDARSQSRRIRKEAAAQEARLVVLQAKERDMIGKEFPLTGEMALGRGDDNDVKITDNFVSHHHAIITKRRNQYVIEDLHSANGTYLNDLPLEGRAYLKNRDLIRIGYLTMRFER